MMNHLVRMELVCLWKRSRFVIAAFGAAWLTAMLAGSLLFLAAPELQVGLSVLLPLLHLMEFATQSVTAGRDWFVFSQTLPVSRQALVKAKYDASAVQLAAAAAVLFCADLARRIHSPQALFLSPLLIGLALLFLAVLYPFLLSAKHHTFPILLLWLLQFALFTKLVPLTRLLQRQPALSLLLAAAGLAAFLLSRQLTANRFARLRS